MKNLIKALILFFFLTIGCFASDIVLPEGTSLQDIKMKTKMYTASDNIEVGTTFANKITNIENSVDNIQNIITNIQNNVDNIQENIVNIQNDITNINSKLEKAWPSLNINMSYGYDNFTDVIIKASTNNFKSICYCFVSFYDTTRDFTDPLNLMNKYCHPECLDFEGESALGPGCYFTDSQSANVLSYNFKTNAEMSIRTILVDQERSAVGTILVTPSHRLYNHKDGEYYSAIGTLIPEEDTLSWMNEENSQLQWKYLRVLIEKNEDNTLRIVPESLGGKDAWRTVIPSWSNKKYNPLNIFAN